MTEGLKVISKNGYHYLFNNGRIIYKSKNINKVNSRYEQMVKIQDNQERRLDRFKENPYSLVK